MSTHGAASYASKRAYNRFSSQVCGKGLVGATMTPMFASPISFARICASRAPMSVTLIAFPSLASTSDFRTMIDAMMSALWALTTSGITPYQAQ